MARTELRNHLKFKRLMSRLKLPAPYVMGLLETMWHVTYEAGDAKLGNAEDVELAAEWPGRKGVFFSAIKDEWLDYNSATGVYSVHDLYDHAPKYVKQKLERRNIKDLQQKTGTIEDISGNIEDISGHSVPMTRPDPTQTSNRPVTDPTRPDKTNNGNGHSEGRVSDNSVSGGNGSGGMGRTLRGELSRISVEGDEAYLDKLGALQSFGVNGNTARELAQRKDISLAFIKATSNEITGMAGIEKPAGLLVKKLREHR